MRSLLRRRIELGWRIAACCEEQQRLTERKREREREREASVSLSAVHFSAFRSIRCVSPSYTLKANQLSTRIDLGSSHQTPSINTPQTVQTRDTPDSIGETSWPLSTACDLFPATRNKRCLCQLRCRIVQTCLTTGKVLHSLGQTVASGSRPRFDRCRSTR
jgi:hypothetical protein